MGGCHAFHMQAMLRAITPQIWILLAGLASAFMLGAAHYFEHFEKLYPCPLCLRQREVYWAVIAIAITGSILMRVKPTRRFVDALALLIGLVFLTGAVVAVYHMGAELKWWDGPKGCSGGGQVDPLTVDLTGTSREAVSSCVEPLWHFLGLSMAGWNAVISIGLAVASFVAVNNPFAKSA